MAILVILQNRELAAEIATSLSNSGWRSVVCPSVSSAEFLREFGEAQLIVTDLAPPVLGLLTVNSRRLLTSGVPLLIMASVGHSGDFAAMLAPGQGACVRFEVGLESIAHVRDAALALLRESSRRSIALADPVPAERPSKHVAADPAHSRRPEVSVRKTLQRQDRLLSDIAHDLRTPLTAISEFASLMEAGLAGSMTQQQRQYVGIIERRCQEAARMVDDLLDGAKLQSGRIHPHREPVDLGGILSDARESLAPAIRQSGVTLSLEVVDGLPPVFADRDMLGRIVINLVSNAIKFSPAGGTVHVGVDRSSVSMVRGSVIDSGTGISPEDMRRIFRRFEQGSNRIRNGVGLGLSIVRQLVKLHGGRVTAESTPGKGSQFHFTLPLFLPTAIVHRHLAAAAKKQQPPPTLWALDCPDPAKYGAVHRLITATVSARDLVVPTAANRLILLITASKHPDRLVDRLQRQIAAHAVAVPEVRQIARDELKRLLVGLPAWPTARRGQSDSTPLAG